MKKCFLISGLVLAASGVLGMNDPTECKHGLIKLTLGAKVKPVMFDDPIYYEPITLGKSSSEGTKMGPLTEFDSESFKTVKKNDIEIVEKFLKVIVEKEKQALMHKTNTEMLRRIGGRNHNVLKVPEKSELIGEYREYAEKINKVKERSEELCDRYTEEIKKVKKRSEELRDRMEGFKNWYEKSIENLKARELM